MRPGTANNICAEEEHSERLSGRMRMGVTIFVKFRSFIHPVYSIWTASCSSRSMLVHVPSPITLSRNSESDNNGRFGERLVARNTPAHSPAKTSPT